MLIAKPYLFQQWLGVMSYRDLVLAKQLRREHAAEVAAQWTHHFLSKVFDEWRQVSHEEHFARKVCSNNWFSAVTASVMWEVACGLLYEQGR